MLKKSIHYSVSNTQDLKSTLEILIKELQYLDNNEEIEINDPPIVLVPDVINNLMNKKVIEIN